MTRVQELKEQIERGEYRVDPKLIAATVVERWLQLGVVRTPEPERSEVDQRLARVA